MARSEKDAKRRQLIQELADAALAPTPTQWIQQLAQRVQHASMALRLWSLFCPEDKQVLYREARRRALADDQDPASMHEVSLCATYLGGPVGMWATLHKVDSTTAVLDVSELAGLLTDGQKAHLSRSLGGRADGQQPVWNNLTSVLQENDGRQVTVRASSHSNIRLILDAFQENGWPRVIKSPIPDGKAVRDAVSRFNRRADGPQTFRLSSMDRGQKIGWEPTSKSPPNRD